MCFFELLQCFAFIGEAKQLKDVPRSDFTPDDHVKDYVSFSEVVKPYRSEADHIENEGLLLVCAQEETDTITP